MNLQESILSNVDRFLANDPQPSPRFFGFTTTEFRELFYSHVYVVQQDDNRTAFVYLYLPSKKLGAISNSILNEIDPFAWKCMVKPNPLGGLRAKMLSDSDKPTCLFHEVITDLIWSAVEAACHESEGQVHVP